MTVKEKLKQEEEKLLESVNNSYRDMMRAQFDCIFEELEERCEKSPEYAARVLLSHKSFARCMKYAMKKIMEIRTPTEKEKELARKQEAPIVTPVSSDVLYFSGEAAFEVKEGKEVTAPVICKPSSARINVVFDPKMDEYFSDYSLKIETEAQKPSSFVWAKATVGPMYFKVGNQEKVQVTVSLTKKENVKAEGTVKTYTLSPADALKLTLKPVVNNGNLGISITIEETTVDHPVDIVIPGDWV